MRRDPPPRSADAAPFWSGAERGVLVLPRCDTCQRAIWYPRSFCSLCGSDSVTWSESPGEGVVYSFTVVRNAPQPWTSETPYVIAYVQLAEGPIVLTNIVDVDVSTVRIGQRVVVRFDPVDGAPADGFASVVMRFVPKVTGMPPRGPG